MMSDREKRLIAQFKNGAVHTSDCTYRNLDVPIHDAPCNCYELFWVRVGASSIKSHAVTLVSQCADRDSTIVKLADAINEIE